MRREPPEGAAPPAELRCAARRPPPAAARARFVKGERLLGRREPAADALRQGRLHHAGAAAHAERYSRRAQGRGRRDLADVRAGGGGAGPRERRMAAARGRGPPAVLRPCRWDRRCARRRRLPVGVVRVRSVCCSCAGAARLRAVGLRRACRHVRRFGAKEKREGACQLLELFGVEECIALDENATVDLESLGCPPNKHTNKQTHKHTNKQAHETAALGRRRARPADAHGTVLRGESLGRSDGSARLGAAARANQEVPVKGDGPDRPTPCRSVRQTDKQTNKQTNRPV